jgi:UDP-N-acetylglucosamine transferase subunit ALG13
MRAPSIVFWSSHFGFDRLIVEVDRLAGAGILSDVFAQIGETNYEPQHCRTQRFLTPAQFQANMQKADLVICHAGCGTLEEGLRQRKKMIVVPRLGRLREAPDDHQLEIAHLLASRNRILLAYEVEDLAACVRQVPTWTPSFAPPRAGSPIVKYIMDLITREVVPHK